MFSISAVWRRSDSPSSRITAGTSVEAGLAGGAPAALAGDELVLAAASGRTISGWTTPAVCDRVRSSEIDSGSKRVRG